MRYFGFYSFYMPEDELKWLGQVFSSGLRNVRGGVTPRIGFFGAIGTEYCFICDFSSDRTLLGRA